jgi:hypothetical protein
MDFLLWRIHKIWLLKTSAFARYDVEYIGILGRSSWLASFLRTAGPGSSSRVRLVESTMAERTFHF